jgi:hypothetical protein
MKIYKIKLEDKAAFLNRLEKAKMPLSTSNIEDNKLEGYFEVTIKWPEQEEAIKTILKQSPTINTIKESNMENKKKMSKDALKEMVRQELQSVLAEKKASKDKKQIEETLLNEDLSATESIVAGILGLGIPLASIISLFVSTAVKKGGKVAADELRSAIEKATGTGPGK